MTTREQEIVELKARLDCLEAMVQQFTGEARGRCCQGHASHWTRKHSSLCSKPKAWVDDGLVPSPPLHSQPVALDRLWGGG